MTFDLSELSVAIVTPFRHSYDVTVEYTQSLVATVQLLNHYGIEHSTEFHTGGIIPGTRSYATHKFLQGEKNRLFWIDSDIGWRPDDFMKILALSTRYEVIGACYRAKRDEPFYLATIEGGVKRDENGCIKVPGMGIGFTCIQRGVMEALSSRARKVLHQHYDEPLPAVFRFDEVGGTFRGEDFAFFADVRELGYDVNIDPTIVLGHVGYKQFSGCLMDVMVRRPEPESGALRPVA